MVVTQTSVLDDAGQAVAADGEQWAADGDADEHGELRDRVGAPDERGVAVGVPERVE